jgi:hypothetical protein
MAEKEEAPILIIAGHYKRRSLSGEDSKEIIRVLGPSKTRKGSWVTMDGKTISEHELIDDWEPLLTTPNPSTVQRKNNLMAGLLPMEQAEAVANGVEPEFEEPTIEEEPEHIPKRRTQTPEYKPLDESKFLDMVREPVNGEETHKLALDELPGPGHTKHRIQMPEAPTNSFIASVFEKLSKQSSEESVTITFELPLGFSMDRLKDSMNLLDLDANEIVRHITGSVLSKNKVNNAISAELLSQLTQPKKTRSVREALDERREQMSAKSEGTEVTEEFQQKVFETAVTMLSTQTVPDMEPIAELEKPIVVLDLPPIVKEGPPREEQQVIFDEISDLEKNTKALLAKYIG